MPAILKIFISISFFCFSVFCFSQAKINISGKIIKKNNNKAIPYANIYIEGTFTGSVSDENGNFVLQINEEDINKRLKVSAVGFIPTYRSIKSIAGTSPIQIKLQVSTYGLKDVEIFGVSRLQHTRIRKAISQIEKNYIQKPFNYKFYYTSSQNNDNKMYEAVGRYYDSKGYKYSDPLNTYEERGYQFQHIRKNFTPETFSEHLHQLDDVLSMDIVRSGSNILSKEFLNLNELNLVDVIYANGDSIWVIQYVNTNPTLGSTGNYYVTSYSGKLYLNISDYAIIKNELQIVATNYSRLGRGYYAETNKESTPVTVTYNAVTTYRKFADYYYLDAINYNRVVTYNKKVDKINDKLVITKIEIENPKKITGRTYFDNSPYNELFWRSFSIPKKY